MATSFDMGLLGDIFGGGETGLEGYLTPAQQAAMSRQALLQAAMAIGQASGPSTTPRSLMQILGSGVAAGQQGYAEAQKNAITQLLTKQKIEEAKRAQAAQEAYQRFILGQPADGGEVTPQQAISMPGMAAGPTVERAAMIGQQAPSVAPANMGGLTPQMRQLLATLPAEKGITEAMKLMQPPKTTGAPFKGADGNYYIQTETGGVIPAPVAPETKPVGMPQEAVVNGTPQLVQYYEDGSYKVVTGLSPKAEPSAAEIKILRETGTPVTLENVMKLRRSGATNVTVPVDMTGGQKGFDNEMSLGKSFRSEPIYKDFNDMKSTFSQVVSSFKQGTPIGDVAGATKIMKLLDPGSVVRESELAIAMQAGGRMDRLQNYFNMWASGEKLTPTQRDDFQALANELYAAAGQAYNQKRSEYEQFGRSYGFKNLDTALGKVATFPSVVKKQPAATATPPAIQDILNKYPPRNR